MENSAMNDLLATTMSGAAHYFRTLPEQWPTRMQSLRALGLNTVETYLAWNFHESREGQWKRLEQITRYLDCAGEAGLKAIVRPGPYICAEWDNGGLPMWVTRRAGRLVRTSSPVFMDPVRRYLDRVVPLFVDHAAVSMVQVENEYGSWGDEAAYLRLLADELLQRGVAVPLFTSDGPTDEMLTGGVVPGITPTVNFGSGAEESFAILERHSPGTQPFCMEFWNGWFDHWGESRVTRSAESAAETLQEILDSGGRANLYMAHGGSNFGVFAGANHEWRGQSTYQPTVTSYDYDAPLDERGEPTAKFHALREVLAAHLDLDGEPALPELPPLMANQTVELGEFAEPVFTDRGIFPVPPTFEDLDVEHGLVRYSTTIPGPRATAPLVVRDLRDWAVVSIDGRPRWVVDHCDETTLGEVPGPTDVSVVVESMGRVNYGPRLGDWKGLGSLSQKYAHLCTYRVESLELPGVLPTQWRRNEAAESLAQNDGEGEPPTGAMRPVPDGALTQPLYFRGQFDLVEAADGYIGVPGGTKGYLWVNGFCLGRYWDRGPQVMLYLPQPITREGTNEVVILELVGLSKQEVALRDTPDLGE